MKNLYKKIRYYCFVFGAAGALAFALSSCSKEAPIKPTALVPFTQTTAIRTSWVNKVSMSGNGAYLKLNPAIVNGKAFIAGSSGKVKAVDVNSGKSLWEISVGAPVSSGLGANGSALFIGTTDGYIWALRQLDGRVLWKKPVISLVLAIPAANNEVVIVKTESGAVAAFAVTSGDVLWRHDHQEPSFVLHGSSSPKIAGHSVLCGFADGVVEALDLESGHVMWEQKIVTSGSNTSMLDIIADPVVSGDLVYVVSYYGSLAALNIKTGEIVWQKPLSSSAGLAVADQRVYVVDTSDHLFALSRDDGAVLWEKNVFAYRGLSSPAVLGNLVAVGDAQGYVHWLNADSGQMAARTKVNGGIVSSPAYFDGAIYIFSTAGNLVKFSR